MILKVEHIDTYYGKIRALKDVSLDVNHAEIVGLIGPNGAGKSTLLKSILHVVPTSQGRISFDGKHIENMRTEGIVKSGISYVPEGRHIFPLLTVLENLEVGAYLRSDRKEIAADIQNILGLFPALRDRQGQFGGSLSGGEQQMLAIGRALMGRPKLMLMDEPSLGLAPVLVDRIFEMITQLNEEGLTILLVEQNAHITLEIADRALVLEIGRIVLEGKAGDLIENEQVKQSYLGL